MILDIDIGNTRVKWRTVALSGEVTARGVVVNRDWSDAAIEPGEKISRVRVASVNGEMSDRLVDLCRHKFGVSPEFARVEDGLAGLQCGYGEPSTLGVDRWLAVLACWHDISQEALVVDAGSALTIDVLGGGCHRGGYIIPGVEMMTSALGDGTWGVKAGAVIPELCPGDNTSAAVRNGALLALHGAINQAAEFAGLQRIVLTGGDAALLQQGIASHYTLDLRSDLVMDGLAIALP